MKTKLPILKIALIAWLVFSVAYVAYSEYNRLNNFIAKSAYEKGLTDAVSEVIKQAQKCEAFPIYLAGQGVRLINADCSQMPPSEEGAQ